MKGYWVHLTEDLKGADIFGTELATWEPKFQILSGEPDFLTHLVFRVWASPTVGMDSPRPLWPISCAVHRKPGCHRLEGTYTLVVGQGGGGANADWACTISSMMSHCTGAMRNDGGRMGSEHAGGSWVS